MPVDPRYIDCLFDPGDLMEVRLLPSRRQSFAKAGQITRLDDELAKANHEGGNVYVGVNPRKRPGGKARDVALARCLFIDIDKMNIDAAQKKIAHTRLPIPTCTVASGHGLHAYWRLVGPMTNLEDWTVEQKRLVQLLDSDPKVHDPPRIMRLPGFANHKPPSADCRVIDADPRRRYDLNEIVPDRTKRCSRVGRDLRSQDSDVSAVSDVSATPGYIISITQPKCVGERNEQIMNLARGLKFECDLKGQLLTMIKPHVKCWHQKYLPVIGTKPFDETWADFIRAWDKARIPLFSDPVGQAFTQAVQQAREGALPRCADNYDTMPVRLLIGLCANLAALNGNDRFFLSSHTASDHIDKPPAQTWRYLNMLGVDGVIEVVKKGNQRTATRFRWIGDGDGHHPRLGRV